MTFLLLAIGLGYLQTGSNMLQRDLCGAAIHRPFYASGGTSAVPHYVVAILAWPIIRLARRPLRSSPLGTLAYCVMEWALMAILSALLMFAVGLFTKNAVNQALVVLVFYTFILAGKLGGEW